MCRTAIERGSVAFGRRIPVPLGARGTAREPYNPANSSPVRLGQTQSMTISFDDLISLVGDKHHYSRICAAADRYEHARQALAAAEDALERVERELEDLCESHSDAGDSTEHDEPDADSDEEVEDAAAARRAARRRVPRAKPTLPGSEEGDPRAPDEYVNALDEVGHELGTTGGVAIRSSAVVSAMKNRGFPDRSRVMAFLKAHPSWHALPDGHSMFRYAFAPRTAVVEEPAASEG